MAESYNFEIEDDILKHFYSKRCKRVPKEEKLVKQIVIPRTLRDDIPRSYHDCLVGGGHQGFVRTYSALRNNCFLPSMYRLAKIANHPKDMLELNDHHYNPSQVMTF